MKKRYLLILLLCTFLLTGCAREVKQEEHLIVSSEVASVTYKLGPVERGNVEKTAKLYATYKQMREENLSFSVSAKQVTRVNVKEGDSVKAGDLLAELSGGSLASQIDSLTYKIARNEILLDDAKTNRDYDLQTARVSYEAGYMDKETYERQKEMISKNYSYTIEDLTDSLELDRLQLSIYEEDLASSKLYAGMDGTVTYVKKSLKGSTSIMNENVITIIDDSECLFAVSDSSYAKYFGEKDPVSMNIAFGTAAGDYTLFPYNYSNWDKELTFMLSDSEEKPVINVGDSGTIRVITERAENVLYVPNSAVHNADDKHYVFVLTDENIRSVRWIEAGLIGDEYTEVISGLTEGEMVVLR